MANNIAYNGSDKWKIKATQLLNQGGGGGGSEGSLFSLDGRKFIFIGDSYQEGWTDSSGTVITIDSWLDYFISWYGSEFNGYYRNQAGGWGFAKTNCQFITLLQALESTITDKADITDIVVEGGFNDHAYLSEIDSAILAFRNYARQTYPNATLWIAPVSRGINQFEADADSAHKIYIDSGMKYGFNICGEITRVMLNEDYYSTDLVHPTADGYKQICKHMHQCLTTGACDLLTGVAETADLATVATSGNYNDLTNKPTIPAAQIQSDWTQSNTSSLDYIKHKPSLATVATSGSYTDLSNKPTNATQSVSGLMSSTDKTKLDGIASGAEVNVQSDWNELDNSADDFIKNKPTLGTAAAKNYTDNMTSGASGDLPTKSAVASALAGYVPAALLDQYINIDEGQYDGTFDVYYFDGTTISHDIVPFGNAVNFIRHGGTLKGTADEGVDLDNYTGSDARHIFWVEVNQYTDNAPVANGSYGNFEAFGSMQRFSRYKQAGSGECYQRHYVNNTWTPWMRINQDIHTLVTDDMTTAVTLTSGSYGTLASVTLAKGIWQLNARASFASNATGNRAIMVTSSNTSTSSYDGMYVRVPSAGGSHTTGLCVSGCFELAQQTTLYLRGFQNSGGNLNASSASIRAIRIA